MLWQALFPSQGLKSGKVWKRGVLEMRHFCTIKEVGGLEGLYDRDLEKLHRWEEVNRTLSCN